MYIKPINGKQIPDPVRGGFLPEAGGNADDHDIYWQRRINDQDVEITNPPAESAAPTTKK